MLTTLPDSGAIAYGRSGIPYEVVEVRPHRLTLRRSDGGIIEVQPSAIIRWEKVSKFPSAESQVKVSSEPSETKNKALEPLADELSTSDDNSKKYRQNIVRQDKVSSEDPSIVRSIVRSKTHTEKDFQQSSDGSDGSDDIFACVSAEGNFETFVSEQTLKVGVRSPTTIQKGSTVGKAYNLGWLGWVQSEPIDGRVDVLWQYDQYPTLEKINDLKLKELQ